MSITVGVRHRNGALGQYRVDNVETWQQARDFVLEQVPTAYVVVALIVGGRGLPELRPAA